jgi:hypothetical protein
MRNESKPMELQKMLRDRATEAAPTNVARARKTKMTNWASMT